MGGTYGFAICEAGIIHLRSSQSFLNLGVLQHLLHISFASLLTFTFAAFWYGTSGCHSGTYRKLGGLSLSMFVWQRASARLSKKTSLHLRMFLQDMWSYTTWLQIVAFSSRKMVCWDVTMAILKNIGGNCWSEMTKEVSPWFLSWPFMQLWHWGSIFGSFSSLQVRRAIVW